MVHKDKLTMNELKQIRDYLKTKAIPPEPCGCIYYRDGNAWLTDDACKLSHRFPKDEGERT